MAFFRRIQKKVNNLWYPQSVTWGKAVTTREVADELSAISTVTRGDTFAVMENLGRVLSGFMGQGRTVKIDGVGTFYYTASSTKKGVQTAEEVSASLINGVRVRFLPEVERNSGSQIITRSMVNTKVVWKEWGKTSASGNGGNGDGAGGGEEENHRRAVQGNHRRGLQQVRITGIFTLDRAEARKGQNHVRI